MVAIIKGYTLGAGDPRAGWKGSAVRMAIHSISNVILCVAAILVDENRTISRIISLRNQTGFPAASIPTDGLMASLRRLIHFM
jgi:hypothetical protein